MKLIVYRLYDVKYSIFVAHKSKENMLNMPICILIRMFF